MKSKSKKFNGDVYAWCEHHDNHSPEGWLYLVLDGTISLEEMRRAVLEGRSPKPKK